MLVFQISLEENATQLPYSKHRKALVHFTTSTVQPDILPRGAGRAGKGLSSQVLHF